MKVLHYTNAPDHVLPIHDDGSTARVDVDNETIHRYLTKAFREGQASIPKNFAICFAWHMPSFVRMSTVPSVQGTLFNKDVELGTVSFEDSEDLPLINGRIIEQLLDGLTSEEFQEMGPIVLNAKCVRYLVG